MKSVRLLLATALITMLPILSGCGEQAASQNSQAASSSNTITAEKTSNQPVQNAQPSDSNKPQPSASQSAANAASSLTTPNTQTETKSQSATVPSNPAISSNPSNTAQSSVEIIGVTSPAARNSTATLTAKVTPGATASIVVNYKSGPSHAAGLESKQADSNGNVSWSWHVGGNTTLGYWPITVSCNGSSATTQFQVVH